MEDFKTSKFTAKDVFNSSSATPIKDAADQTITVEAIAVKTKPDGEVCGLLKATDGKIFATISATVLDQLTPLAEMVEEEPQNVKIVSKRSNQNREYFMLELV